MTLLLLLASTLLAAPAAQKAAVHAFPGTVLALPAGAGIKVDWVLKPIKADAAPGTRSRFDVDPDGRPWFADGDQRLLVNPLKGYAMKSSAKFEDFVFLDSGDRLLCTTNFLGALLKDKELWGQENGVPVLRFEGKVKLPHGGCRLYSGGDTLYITWRNDPAGKDELTLLSTKPGAKKAQKLLSLGGHINAVAGDGKTTFFAIGSRILRLDAGQSDAKLYFEAKELVTSLAWSEKTGLFYTTDHAVGFAGPQFHQDFILTPEPRAVLRGSTLYVRLGKTTGVIKVTGAERFQRLRYAKK